VSSRTALTVLDSGAYAEDGPTTKTLENMDVTNGNKFTNDGRVLLKVRNSAVAARTITYTYDERGAARTRAVTLAASEETILGPFPVAIFNEHAADASEHRSHVWATASGAAGEVKARAIRYQPGAFT
jgi:hypothetical protein